VTDSDLAPDVDDAGTTAAPADVSGTEAIVVRLGAGTFVIELTSVAEVGRIPVVTRVPGGPVWLAGVANWRGRILAVLDLRSMLGAEPAPLARDARLVVLSSDGMAAGMIVDAVAGTTSLTDVAAWPTASAPIGSGLLSGQSPRDDGPLAVIDVAAVMRLRENLPRGRRIA
jgi:purine-binding chemotaxis protein CheW